jgi:hypothetical protein
MNKDLLKFNEFLSHIKTALKSNENEIFDKIQLASQIIEYPEFCYANVLPNSDEKWMKFNLAILELAGFLRDIPLAKSKWRIDLKIKLKLVEALILDIERSIIAHEEAQKKIQADLIKAKNVCIKELPMPVVIETFQEKLDISVDGINMMGSNIKNIKLLEKILKSSYKLKCICFLVFLTLVGGGWITYKWYCFKKEEDESCRFNLMLIK